MAGQVPLGRDVCEFMQPFLQSRERRVHSCLIVPKPATAFGIFLSGAFTDLAKDEVGCDTGDDENVSDARNYYGDCSTQTVYT